MGVTIYDIAKKAGVSTCWVSYVLRNHPRAEKVSPLVRERIKAAAADLHYHPNLSAVTISNGFNHSTIAMIVPGRDGDISMNYMHSQYFRCIRFFNDHGYGVRIYCGSNMEEIFREILSNQIRYVFVNLSDPEKRDLCAEFCRKNQLKAAFRGCHCRPYPDFPSFDSDDRAMVISLTQYLAGLGHSRIAAVFGSLKFELNRERRQAWLDGLEKSGLQDCSSMSVHVHGFSDAAFLGLLREHHPTAVFAADSSLAVRIMHFCSFYRIAVPQAFSLAAFNYYDNRFYSPLAIAGAEQESIVKRIEESVLAFFEGRITGSAFFAGGIVPGESVAPPSGDLSWLDRLPESFEMDRKWFPDNRIFENREDQ